MFALTLATAHAAYILSLSCRLQTYHTAADRLQLIPVTAKYAGGVQFEIQLDRAGATASDIINADLKVAAFLPYILFQMLFFVSSGLLTLLLLPPHLLSTLPVSESASAVAVAQALPRLFCVVYCNSFSLLAPCT